MSRHEAAIAFVLVVHVVLGLLCILCLCEAELHRGLSGPLQPGGVATYVL